MRCPTGRALFFIASLTRCRPDLTPVPFFIVSLTRYIPSMVWAGFNFYCEPGPLSPRYRQCGYPGVEGVGEAAAALLDDGWERRAHGQGWVGFAFILLRA